MPWKGEMLVEGPTGGFEYVAAMGVDAQIGGGFRFPDVLGLWAQGAVAEVNDVSTAAVQIVEDTQSFSSVVAGEGLGRLDVPATLVLGGS